VIFFITCWVITRIIYIIIIIKLLIINSKIRLKLILFMLNVVEKTKEIFNDIFFSQISIFSKFFFPLLSLVCAYCRKPFISVWCKNFIIYLHCIFAWSKKKGTNIFLLMIVLWLNFISKINWIFKWHFTFVACKSLLTLPALTTPSKVDKCLSSSRFVGLEVFLLHS
jgi:hypothetical protein